MAFQWQWATWSGLVLAVLHLAAAVLLLRLDRTIADEYMAATPGRGHDGIRRKHEKLRHIVIGAIIVAFTFAGLYGFATLYGMTFVSFWAIDALFLPLLITSPVIHFFLLLLSGVLIPFAFMSLLMEGR
ncbi:hypothetical protein AAVH_32165 [Aphelenchoides avenae]|nr:hypothetical protein AAVH_32165 [Aphelenchus avenae]